MEEEERFDSEPSETSGGRLLGLLLIRNQSSPFGPADQLEQAAPFGHSAPSPDPIEGQTQSTWSLLLTALFYKLDKFDINWSNFLLASILIMLMLTTAVGNLFVIVAILIERNLRTIGNYLVLSLAIADLLVACLVMPLAGIYQILERWTLGILLCDIWTSADVFCCTGKLVERFEAIARFAHSDRPAKPI